MTRKINCALLIEMPTVFKQCYRPSDSLLLTFCNPTLNVFITSSAFNAKVDFDAIVYALNFTLYFCVKDMYIFKTARESFVLECLEFRAQPKL